MRLQILLFTRKSPTKVLYSDLFTILKYTAEQLVTCIFLIYNDNIYIGVYSLKSSIFTFLLR